MDNLKTARGEIDNIDKQMAKLFCERMQAVKQVVEYKKDHGLNVLDSLREQEVIKKNCAYLTNEEYKEYYEHFIKYTMQLSRVMQGRMLNLDKVAYQGAKGAFTHIAAKELYPFGTLIACNTWSDVFEAVVNGDVFYGVLPFENSHAGDVSDVLDLCYATQNIIISEVFDLPVTQNLLCIKGAKLSDIKTVISHPQALSQSAKMIKSLGFNAESYANTALAAQYVSEKGDKSIAAIASVQTANIYGLDVLLENMNESKDNTTRFIVIKKCEDDDFVSNFLGNDNTSSQQQHDDNTRFSLLFTTTHKTGSLSSVIQTIASFGYNMECIKSRPIPHASWEYYFYTELVGKPCKELFSALSSNCHTVRFLGAYNKRCAK